VQAAQIAVKLSGKKDRDTTLCSEQLRKRRENGVLCVPIVSLFLFVLILS